MKLGDEGARRETGGLGAALAYEMVRKELLAEFGAEFFRAYIDSLTLVAEWNGTLLFRTNSPAAQERLRQRVQHRLEARLRVYDDRVGPVEILLEGEVPDDVRALATARIEDARAAAPPSPSQSALSFDSFCVDGSNERAFAVAEMIASGQSPFPVWLVHSPPGFGKTHLLTGLARTAVLHNPDLTVLSMTGQEYLERFQSALLKRESAAFKEAVRAPDLLIIDDFHRICGKKATEEEAFDTIFEVTRRGGIVVLAANHSAEGLEGLDETLRAKLKGAAATEIQAPNAALRRRILESRLAHHARVSPGFSVASDALDMIAQRIEGSGRDLDGALSQLLIEWKISGGKTVTLDAAANALQSKFAAAAERRVTVQLVQKVVARHYNMTVQQLLERTRRQAIARPRQVAMFLACRLTNASLPDIGQRFGGYDHTTVMYARERIAQMAEQDPLFKAEVENIIRDVKREA